MIVFEDAAWKNWRCIETRRTAVRPYAGQPEIVSYYEIEAIFTAPAGTDMPEGALEPKGVKCMVHGKPYTLWAKGFFYDSPCRLECVLIRSE
jgi:hypothetical protein